MFIPMSHDDLQPAIAIQIADFLFPGAATVRSPLKWQRLDMPRLAVEFRRQLQGAAKNGALSLVFMRLSGRAPQWKIQETSSRRLNFFSGFEQHAHAERGKPARFERPRDHSRGAMACRTKWKKKNEVDALRIVNFLHR